MIVTPDTVLRWQRRRFREYWTKLSGRLTGGRPSVNADIMVLVTRLAATNPLWGAPRIHGELLKLGLDVLAYNVARSFQLDTIATPRRRSRKRTYAYAASPPKCCYRDSMNAQRERGRERPSASNHSFETALS